MAVIQSPAVLVRSVAYGEADLILTLFTESDGKVAAVARGARRSAKRFGGALEPIHELVVAFEDKGKELCVLREARIFRAHTGITADLDALDAAGRALRWIRHLCPSRTREPSVWSSLVGLLDALDTRTETLQNVAAFGIKLLADMGYGIDFQGCVRCGKPCPEGRSAFLDPAGGGLVCMACGGARRTMDSELRRVARGVSAGECDLRMTVSQAGDLVTIVEEALSIHADFDPHAGR